MAPILHEKSKSPSYPIPPISQMTKINSLVCLSLEDVYNY